MWRFPSRGPGLEETVARIDNPIAPEGFARAPAILVVDGDPRVRRLLGSHLRRAGCLVQAASSRREALRLAQQPPSPDLIVLDLDLPNGGGLATLRALREAHCRAGVIVTKAGARGQEAVRAVEEGAYVIVDKNASFEALRLAIRNGLETIGLKKEVETLRARLHERKPESGEVVWAGAPMRRVMKLVQKVADSRISVLLQGECGTGKELIARAIHAGSGRHHRPFVAVDCAAIPERSMESELFGHSKGSFTGATARRAGRFEEAHGGTLFLDEVAELSPTVQAELLRVLQTGKLRPVGGRAREVNVRIISAGNRSLEDGMARERFRPDLYYRLAVYPILLPPLRERREDIPLLIRHFVRRFAAQEGRAISGVAPQVEARLLDYPWPGNVRELEDLIFRAVVLAETQVLQPRDFPLFFLGAPPPPPPARREPAASGAIPPLEEVELLAMQGALQATGGNVSRAARRLRIGRATLYRKFKKHGIPLR